MSFFVVKKFITAILMPLPLLLLLMGIALILLWFTRWQKSAKVIFSLSWLVLLLISLQPVADRLLLPFETHYKTWNKHHQVASLQPDYIVVLGAGYTITPDWAPGSRLRGGSLSRVTEGIRLYLAYPNARLVFTGGGTGEKSNARIAALVAESLGVPASAIIMSEQLKDTEDEAEHIARLVGKKTFVLVTSASHLPRAMRYMKAKGLHPIAAPANQLAITMPLNLWESLFPSATFLSHSERAWYEMVGTVWQYLKTSINTTSEAQITDATDAPSP